jgi:hypothetical protein
VKDDMVPNSIKCTTLNQEKLLGHHIQVVSHMVATGKQKADQVDFMTNNGSSVNDMVASRIPKAPSLCYIDSEVDSNTAEGSSASGLKNAMGRSLVVKTEGNSVNKNVLKSRNDDLVVSTAPSASSHEGDDKVVRNNRRLRKRCNHRGGGWRPNEGPWHQP